MLIFQISLLSEKKLDLKRSKRLCRLDRTTRTRELLYEQNAGAVVFSPECDPYMEERRGASVEGPS